MNTQAPGTTLDQRHTNWLPLVTEVHSIIDRHCPKFRGTDVLQGAALQSTHSVTNANRGSITDENKHEFDLTSLISNFDRPTPEEIELRYTTTLAETIERNQSEILKAEILDGAMADSRHHMGLLLWLE